MFCRVCGQQVYDNAVVCLNCGCDPRNGENFCPNCGKQKTNPLQVVCLHCGTSLTRTVPTQEMFHQTAHFKHKDKKIPAALLAFFLGGLGIHCFYLDNTSKGMTMLLICLFGAFILLGPLITWIWALVDFIRILCMSDKEFERFVDKKEW